MTKFFAWFGRTILLPLLPAIAGSVLRSIFADDWSVTSIDSVELAFSVALVGVITLTGVTRLPDKVLRAALSPLFVLSLTIAISVFASALFLNAFHNAEQLELLAKVRTTVPVSMDQLRAIGLDDRCTMMQSRLRTAALYTGVLSILLAVMARLKYNIEDDDTLSPEVGRTLLSNQQGGTGK